MDTNNNWKSKTDPKTKDDAHSDLRPSYIFSVKEIDPDMLLEELGKFEEIKDSFKTKSSKKQS